MLETNIITAEMHGIKVTGSPVQIAELKKLLDEQNPIRIKFNPQTQPYIYPQSPYIYDKTTPNPYWKDVVWCGTSVTTSNDLSCITSNGSVIQNQHLTN